MTGSTWRLGRLLGVEIRIDASWLIIAFLLTWSLADHYFPMAHAGWAPGVYWLMALLTSVLFFGSVLGHELAHSAVSRAYGMPVRDITLFIFGGAAHIEREPRRAREELLMALAGPAASLAAGGLFGALWLVSRGTIAPLHALAGWLAWMNVALGLFNLIPGFPLDGGRVFRAIVWSITGNARQSARVAAGVGQMVAYGFIIWGVLAIFGGNWANGLWIAFIGWFLSSAAADSRRALAVEDLLAGHTVREAMLTDCPRVSRRLTLDVVVEGTLVPSGRHCFPVVDEDRVEGLLTHARIDEVPRQRWKTTRVEDVMIPWTEVTPVGLDDELAGVVERMSAEGANQLPVVDDGRFVGMVASDSLLNFIRTRAEGKQAA